MAAAVRPPRHAAALAAVLLLHGAALWALQQGLLQRTIEAITAPEMLVEILQQEAALPPSAAVPKPQPLSTRAPAPSTPRTPAPQLQTAPPQPLVQDMAPSTEPAVAAAAPTAPGAASATANPTAAPAAASGSATAVAAAPAPAAPKLQQPSSDADYLNNPKPLYPPMSRRLGEQGSVLVHTLIGADGMAQKADIARSSGFERLDRAALETVLKWRYVPGKRGGVPEAMWFNVPIHFHLD